MGWHVASFELKPAGRGERSDSSECQNPYTVDPEDRHGCLRDPIFESAAGGSEALLQFGFPWLEKACMKQLAGAASQTLEYIILHWFL